MSPQNNDPNRSSSEEETKSPSETLPSDFQNVPSDPRLPISAGLGLPVPSIHTRDQETAGLSTSQWNKKRTDMILWLEKAIDISAEDVPLPEAATDDDAKTSSSPSTAEKKQH
jgi:hypothetical protein